MGGDLYPYQDEFEDKGTQNRQDLERIYEKGVELLKNKIRPGECISGIILWRKNRSGEYKPKELK